MSRRELNGTRGEMGDIDIGIESWGLHSLMYEYTALIWVMELLLFC